MWYLLAISQAFSLAGGRKIELGEDDVNARLKVDIPLFLRFSSSLGLVAAWGWAATPTFQHDVLPLMEKKCVACHGATKPAMGGLDLRTLAGVMAGSSHGAVVVPGNAEGSRLWVMVRDGKMPMDSAPLSDEDKQLIRDWIEKGQFPAANGSLTEIRKNKISNEARQWWSFKTPVKPAVPPVRNASKAGPPIDAFIKQKLEAKGWTLGPEADKRTLLRRAYFDLLGMPPTPEQVNEFLADSKPNAYERLIDRLLDSPHYGERWGRHWLDVVGYSDSIGNSTDEIRSLSWRYRDYVINALNHDKPYNQFLLEQFAGDQLVNYDPDAKPKAEDIDRLVATGFLRVEPDYGDQQPIYQVDKYFDTLQVTTETSLKAVMGIQLACAKCHDHKFDPILQEDYYKLVSVFEPALDPEKWIAATSFSYGTWPSRHMLNVAPEDREAWIKAIKDEYQKIRRERGAVTAAVAKALKTGAGNDSDSTDAPSAAELEKIDPELAKRAVALKEHEDAYKKLDQQRIWGLWDVSKKPTQTHILVRGNYLVPGDPVEPGIPAVLDNPQKPFRFPEPKPEWHHTGRRLALAQWLTQPDHPLTTRVIVNRVWQYHFGEGIVRTPDDFGSQGAAPTHPELLDWLATSFIENGWSLKWLHKQIMLSAAYRQSSVEDPAKLAADPSDKLLWRKAPMRLEAEEIRDAMLLVSGRLDQTQFGEPVAVRKAADGQYVEDQPMDAPHRRSIYVLTRKSAPQSFLLAFDQPTMDAGNMAVRFRSALPVQSLALMNNPLVIESAKAFAKRIEKEAGEGMDNRLRRAYELAYSRPPRPDELKIIHAALEAKSKDQSAWRTVCQALFGANEFLYSY
jgi:hypothetical protein